MNKGLFAILAAAALAAGKNKNPGSFAKRNKSLEKFDAWINASRGDFKSEIHGRWPENDISLFDCYKDFAEDNISRLDYSTDVWFYSSLYMALCLTQGKAVFSEEHSFENRFYFGEFDFNRPSQNSMVRKIAEQVLKDISVMKRIAGVTSGIVTEDVCSKIIQDANRFSLVNASNMNRRTWNERAIMEYALNGYFYIHYIRMIISVSMDKDLAKLSKTVLWDLSKNGKIKLGAFNGEGSLYGESELLNCMLLFVPIEFTALRDSGLDVSKYYRRKYRMVSEFIFSMYSRDIMWRMKPSAIKEGLPSFGFPSSFPPSSSSSSLANGILKAVFASGEDGDNIVLSFSKSIMEDLREMTLGTWRRMDSMEMTSKFVDLHHFADDLDRQFCGEGWCPGDDLFRSEYGGKLSELSYLYDGDKLAIEGVDTYIKLLNEYSQQLKEIGYSSLEDAVCHYLDEETRALELESLQFTTNGLAFKQTAMRLHPSDRVVAELPLVGNPGESSPRVTKVLLVEYGSPSSLENVSRNTPGNLCVGSSSQGYKQALRKGNQRHFGILMETEFGFHPLYHTHFYSDGRMSSADFTNLNNSEGYGPDNPYREDHKPALERACEAFRRMGFQV